MQNVDRIIRVIYRELFSKILDSNTIEKDLKVDYSLNNTDFVRDIIYAYLKIYPNNYNYEEVNILVEKVKDEIKHKYNNLNPLYIIMLYANEILLVESNRLKVKFDDLFEWNGFITKIDSNIFQAAFLQNSNGLNCETVIEHDNERLYNILKTGLYENHMHLNGSGYSWEINWDILVCSKPFNYIKRKISKNIKLAKYANENYLRIDKIKCIRLYLIWIILGKKKEYHFEISRILKNNYRFYMYQDLDKLTILYDLSKEYFKKQYGDSQEVNKKERNFLIEIFKCFNNGQLNNFDKNLLNIYLAELSELKFIFVQDNIGMGFSKFKDCEMIKSDFMDKKEDKLLLESVLEKYYSEGVVLAIEVRIAPKDKTGLIKKIKELEKVNEKVYKKYLRRNKCLKKIKIGIIIHYIKMSEKFTNNGCRHSNLRGRIKKAAVGLDQYFESGYKSDIKVVGIDAANVEIDCPPEVLAPIFRKHRANTSSKYDLGFTYHVGEEFLTLASGLRAIDDLIEFFNFKSGDRLGHALSLGLDPDKYFSTKRNLINTTLESHVDDLVFLHKINCALGEANLCFKLEQEFIKYASKLFVNTLESLPLITDYRDSYALRGNDPKYLDNNICSENQPVFMCEKDHIYNFNNSNHNEAFKNKLAHKLLGLYHYNEDLYNTGKTSLSINVEDFYINAVKNVQKYMIKRVHNIGISIEINPSSNKKISFIDKYSDLTVYKLNNYKLPNADNTINNLHVSINTDDSGIFETNLSTEYSYIALSLIKDGVDKEIVYEYIEYLIKMGKDASFLNKTIR